VAIEQIHKRKNVFPGIIVVLIFERIGKIFRIYPEFFISNKSFYRYCKSVIHYRVESVAVKPFSRVENFIVFPIFPPNFAGKISVGINLFYLISKFFPEINIHHIRNVQTPAVNSVGRVAIAIGVHPTSGAIETTEAGAIS